MSSTLAVALTLVAVHSSSACADPGDSLARNRRAALTPAPEAPHPYDEGADAAATIDAALAASRADGKRVLLVFGANWCVWCRRLQYTFEHDRAVRAALERSFRVVHVDTGARRSGTNAAIVSRYGEPTRLGLPVLVVLRPDGAVALTQETGALETGDRHSPSKILGFLRRAQR